MSKRIYIVAALGVLLLFGAACSKSSNTTNTSQNNQKTATINSAAVTTSAVSIQNMSFSPTEITIAKGTTVTWTNNDSVAHTVTGNATGPASSTIQPGGTYQFTFDSAGTFPYHCSIHPSMTGTVQVTS